MSEAKLTKPPYNMHAMHSMHARANARSFPGLHYNVRHVAVPQRCGELLSALLVKALTLPSPLPYHACALSEILVLSLLPTRITHKKPDPNPTVEHLK